MTLTETGSLIVGVEHDGVLHKEFEIREQLVMDTVAIFENPDTAERAAKSDSFFSVAILAARITRLGDIPKDKITAEMVLGMHQLDYNVLAGADGRLEKKRSTFQG